MTIKQKIFEVIDENNRDTTLSRTFNLFIVGLIVLNVFAIILESFEQLRQNYLQEFYYFEIFSVTVFTIEYLLRLYTANLKYPGKTTFKGILYFIKSPSAIVDLLAILPAYLPLLLPVDLRYIRLLRLLRIARLLKIIRYSRSLKLIEDVFVEKRSELGITALMTFILLIVASTLMYNIEGQAQPEEFPNIIASFWWAVATLTTVGYGDVYPITGWGKFVSGIIALLGIGLIALPTGILSSAFIAKMNSTKADNKCEKCPTCGHELRSKAKSNEPFEEGEHHTAKT